MKEKPNSILAALWVIRKTLTQPTPHTNKSVEEEVLRGMGLPLNVKLKKDPHPVKKA